MSLSGPLGVRGVIRHAFAGFPQCFLRRFVAATMRLNGNGCASFAFRWRLSLWWLTHAKIVAAY